MDLVLSFEHFSRVTNFPNVLCNTITQPQTSSSDPKLTSLVTNMANNYQRYDALIKDFQSYACKPVSNFVPDSVLSQWLFSNVTSTVATSVSNYYNNKPFCTLVATQFSALNLTPILSDVSSNPTFTILKTDMCAIFMSVFAMLYGEFVGGFCPVGGSVCGKIPSNIGGYNSLVSKATTIITYIESNIYQYMLSNSSSTSYNSIDTFLDLIYIDILEYAATATNGFNVFMYNLFFIAFQPYFCFLYIVSQLPSITTTSTSHAIPSNIIRGTAVLSLYKFVAYTLYGTYLMSSNYDPASSDSLLLRQAVDINVISLFNAEYEFFMKQLDIVPNTVQETISEIGSLGKTNQQITMARSNALNIASNETQVNAAGSRAAKSKTIWSALLITYIVVAIVMFCVVFFLKGGEDAVKAAAAASRNNIMIQVFLGTSVAIFIVLCVFGIIGVVKG